MNSQNSTFFKTKFFANLLFVCLLGLYTTQNVLAQDDADNALDTVVDTAEETASELLDSTAVSLLPPPTISVDNPIESRPEQVQLAWDLLDEADGYNFELCADNECNRVMLYYNNLKDAKVNFKDLKVQQYYWRVSSVDVDGYEGQYSPPQPLLISDAIVAPAPSTNNALSSNSSEINTAGFIGPLPWYVWIVIAAYLGFMFRVANWYFANRS